MYTYVRSTFEQLQNKNEKQAKRAKNANKTKSSVIKFAKIFTIIPRCSSFSKQKENNEQCEHATADVDV